MLLTYSEAFLVCPSVHTATKLRSIDEHIICIYYSFIHVATNAFHLIFSIYLLSSCDVLYSFSMS